MHAGIANSMFPLKSVAGKTFPALMAQPAILRIWTVNRDFSLWFGLPVFEIVLKTRVIWGAKSCAMALMTFLYDMNPRNFRNNFVYCIQTTYKKSSWTTYDIDLQSLAETNACVMTWVKCQRTHSTLWYLYRHHCENLLFLYLNVLRNKTSLIVFFEAAVSTF